MPYANPEDQREYYREWTKGVRRGPPDSVQLGTLLALIVSSPPGECWVWTGSSHGRAPHLYGCLGYKGKRHATHRLAYELVKGPIPDGLTLDHLCRNKLCFNPEHLEAVTHAENCRRAMRDHCKHGHAYTPENTYIRPGDGNRRCLTCQRTAKRRSRDRTPRPVSLEATANS